MRGPDERAGSSGRKHVKGSNEELVLPCREEATYLISIAVTKGITARRRERT